MSLRHFFDFLIVLSLNKRINAKIEGFIVNGLEAAIRSFPYAAFLGASCGRENYGWACGSSILNQHILLTAAHCLEGCDSYKMFISARVGNENRLNGVESSMERYVIHERWIKGNVANDIGLIKLKTALSLKSKVSRVILMRKPPHSDKAQLAGWGMVNEASSLYENVLKYTIQTVLNRDTCLAYLNIPLGAFCAGVPEDVGYASWGDSGSALTVYNYFQIGLVSYKVPTISTRLIVYTDIAYFYDWIRTQSKRVFCNY